MESYNLKQLKIDANNHYLINYSWPGNVRELRNLIERIAILSPGYSEDQILNIVIMRANYAIYDNYFTRTINKIPC